MRNVVAHGYGFIDYRIVWRAPSDVLPHDMAAIKSILERDRNVPARQAGVAPSREVEPPQSSPAFPGLVSDSVTLPHRLSVRTSRTRVANSVR